MRRKKNIGDWWKWRSIVIVEGNWERVGRLEDVLRG